MTRKFILAIVVAVGLVTLFSTAEAGWDEGMATYERGDYERPCVSGGRLPSKGMFDTQLNLGAMYRDGQGVPQDYAVPPRSRSPHTDRLSTAGSPGPARRDSSRIRPHRRDRGQTRVGYRG